MGRKVKHSRPSIEPPLFLLSGCLSICFFVTYNSVMEIKGRRQKTSKPLVNIGRTIGGVMAHRRPTYHEDLLERLKDPAYAVEYLEAVLEEGDMPEVFLLALCNVTEARGMTGIELILRR